MDPLLEENEEKKFRSFVKRLVKMEKKFSMRRDFVLDVSWALRRAEGKGVKSFDKIEDVTQWIQGEIKSVQAEKKARYEAEAQKLVEVGTGEITVGRGPMIEDDTVYRLESAIRCIQGVASSFPSGSSPIKFLESHIQKNRLKKIEELEQIIVKTQVGLEVIKRLMCKEHPDYNNSGYIFMHMYEHFILRIIKHEIASNITENDFGIEKISEEDLHKFQNRDMFANLEVLDMYERK